MPGGPARVHPAAIAEARAAREWYSARSPEAAEAFLAELDEAIERINQTPHQWPPYLRCTRRYLLRRFPLFVVFREAEDRVEILAVAHGRRRPGYWLER